jgi:hypothetical protein
MAKNNFEYNLAGLAFIVCVLGGIGIGVPFDKHIIGAVVGAAVGLSAMALIIKFKIK